jgi:glycine amidinotransferase
MINSSNEWDTLKEIVVGSARGANWPNSDPVFARESEKTTWTATPVPSGPVPRWIIEETEEDLFGLMEVLLHARVTVQ